MTRDLAKTISFLALHLLVGFSVAYALTGSVAIAGGIALIEPVINSIVFFFHERAWRGELCLPRHQQTDRAATVALTHPVSQRQPALASHRLVRRAAGCLHHMPG